MYLGCNVYFWGEREQDRLLAECVKPLAAGAGLRLLCARFDARGPHVMMLFRATPATDGEARARIAAAVEEYLARSPSLASPSAEELEARHVACLGKALCSADRAPGLAPNNSLVLFEHTEQDYPFNLAHDVEARDELWRLREEVVLRALGQLGATSRGSVTAAAVRWMAALDRGVRAAGEPSAPHWRYMAGRVLVGLTERADAEEPTAAKLFSIIGEKNRQALSRIWREGETEAESDLQELVRIVLADDGRVLERRRALLRDLVHTTLILLGLTVQQQAPLLLFAWASASAQEEGS
ncbi:MAG: hypothetical protein ACMG6S_04565 [Byssovorax sp.]